MELFSVWGKIALDDREFQQGINQALNVATERHYETGTQWYTGDFRYWRDGFKRATEFTSDYAGVVEDLTAEIEYLSGRMEDNAEASQRNAEALANSTEMNMRKEKLIFYPNKYSRGSCYTCLINGAMW